MATMQVEDIKIQWRNAGIALAGIFVIVVVAFFNTVQSLVMTWWDKPEYNHCLLILPIIIYLLHERREIFYKVAPAPSWWGLIPLIGGGALWFFGEVADVNVVRQFGLVILLQGCILTILGLRVVHALLFPLFYMVFLIPFGDFLVPLLQDYTTWFVIHVLNILNIPVFVEGVYLSIPAGDFHVAEACAGLRFLVATVALGTLMANVAYKTTGRQMIVVILSIIVPIIANGFRASGIILIAHWSDMEYATGADHLTFGWIFFAIVLLIFISISMTFTNRGIHDGYIDFSKEYWSKNETVATKYFVSFCIVAVAFVSFAPFYASVVEKRYQMFENYSLTLKENIWGEDVTGKTNWEPFFAGASQTFNRHLGQRNPDAVDVFVAYYKYQDKNSELIRYGNGMAQEGKWGRISSRQIEAEIAGVDGSVNEIMMISGISKRIVLYWYWVDGRAVTSKYEAKIFNVKAKVMGGRLDSAVIALSALVESDNIGQQREKLLKFAASLPSLETIISKSE
ncbi:MAG: exosortase A [Emcibacter sp.]|nr:exosortase A [Emcibacter sp.]